MIAGFMHDPIPSSVDPRLLARAGSGLHGVVPLGGMTRLAGMVHALGGMADVDLRFGIDEQKRFRIDGSIDAPVELLCQRCLQPFVCRLTTRPKLVVLADEDQAAMLPAELDPLVVEQFLATAVLVEDELILALPLIPRHEPDQCAPPGDHVPEPVSDDRPRRPFADLGRLLRQNDD